MGATEKRGQAKGVPFKELLKPPNDELFISYSLHVKLNLPENKVNKGSKHGDIQTHSYRYYIKRSVYQLSHNSCVQYLPNTCILTKLKVKRIYALLKPDSIEPI